jgi:hypothetical protein
MWQDRTITSILRNEAYSGTLVCGRTYKNTILKTRGYTKEEEQFRHEDYYPPIIDKTTWEIAQAIIKNRSHNGVRASTNSKIHKYAGLIKCGNCGACFVAKKRAGYIEYVCNSYHRLGIKYCTPHRIREEDIDNLFVAYLYNLKDICKSNLTYINEYAKTALTKNNMDSVIKDCQEKIFTLKDENKLALRQLLKYPEREDMVNEIIEENNSKIKELETIILKTKEREEITNNAKKSIIDFSDVVNSAIKDQSLEYATVQNIVSSIVITSDENDELHIDFRVRSDFNIHIELNELLSDKLTTIPIKEIYELLAKSK